ncbi:Zinc finger CCCH domain-containing protein 64 [Zea mays]|uniref:Zinc finger CCCH domain-containing protein 64 n=1 Tax=Zea mays TaxID=4577 RepID=A0A1D6I371_MAIZE|nr:Zinc finger CCCH domain-containing protein 64 [Zea mays]
MAATSPAPAPPRILLAGDAHGRLHQLFKRVKSVNQSTGPFHALLCVGQFFSPEGAAEGSPEDVTDYLEGRASVPIPTYFTGDYGPAAPRLLSKAAAGARGFAPGGIEICPNVFWLRGSNRFTLHGLSVVYLSGRKGLGGPGCYSQDDVDALRALAEEPGIDDLCFVLASILDASNLGSLDSNEIALMNGRLEWSVGLTLPMCLIRFWIPMGMILLLLNWLLRLNQDITLLAQKVSFTQGNHMSMILLLMLPALLDLLMLETKRSSERRRVESSCWFCLSSPDVESHLVISIGEGYYCTLAKGPLVPNHVLMIPVEHCPSTLMMPPEAEAELGRYKIALSKYFEKQGKTAVYFEWVSPRSHHANLQAVPVPLSKADAVNKIFHLAAKKLGFEFSMVNPDGAKTARESLMSQCESKSGLFYVELPEGRILLHMVDSNEKFPVQFGREVLAGLLSMADRADWRNCKISKEEEIKLVDDFKQGFREFDPAE